MYKWLLSGLLKKWLHHNNQGHWTLTEDWQISLFFVTDYHLEKLNHWQSDCPALSHGQWTGWSVIIATSWDMFLESKDIENRWVSKTEDDCVPVFTKVGKSWPPNISGDKLVAPVLSHITSIYTFTAMAITVSALSYSAVFLKRHHLPSPQILSTSSFNPPAPLAYWFSIFPFLPPHLPVLQLSPSSQTHQFSLSLWGSFKQPFLFFLSLTLLLNLVSFSSLTRSKPQPCSELLKVRKWRCNVIEWWRIESMRAGSDLVREGTEAPTGSWGISALDEGFVQDLHSMMHEETILGFMICFTYTYD